MSSSSNTQTEIENAAQPESADAKTFAQVYESINIECRLLGLERIGKEVGTLLEPFALAQIQGTQGFIKFREAVFQYIELLLKIYSEINNLTAKLGDDYSKIASATDRQGLTNLVDAAFNLAQQSSQNLDLNSLERGYDHNTRSIIAHDLQKPFAVITMSLNHLQYLLENMNEKGEIDNDKVHLYKFPKIVETKYLIKDAIYYCISYAKLALGGLLKLGDISNMFSEERSNIINVNSAISGNRLPSVDLLVSVRTLVLNALENSPPRTTVEIKDPSKVEEGEVIFEKDYSSPNINWRNTGNAIYIENEISGLRKEALIKTLSDYAYQTHGPHGLQNATQLFPIKVRVFKKGDTFYFGVYLYQRDPATHLN